MLRTSLICVALAFTFSALFHQNVSGQAQTPSNRKILVQQDLNLPGYQIAMATVNIPVGGRESRHVHSGTIVVYVQEGELTFEHEGRETKTYKPGDAFYVEPGKIHEGINNGKVPVKLISSYFLIKGKPISTPAPK